MIAMSVQKQSPWTYAEDVAQQFAVSFPNATLCKLCQSIDFSLLTDKTSNGFPPMDASVPIPHHKSRQELERAALDCDLCRLLVNSLLKPEQRETVDEICGPFSIVLDCWNVVNSFRGNYSPMRRIHDFRISYVQNVQSIGRLAVVCPDDTHDFIHHRGVAREPPLHLCVALIEQCSSSHDICKTITDGPMPTRLVDVGNETREPTLVESGDRQGRYVSLSHRWGQAVPLTTTRANYMAHLHQIPLSSLPPTFRDAVLVTRHLGYQYCWIDSLCIIQDSKEDWERESARMDLVYAGAAFNIAAVDSSSALSGFLHQRHAPIEEFCRLEFGTDRGSLLVGPYSNRYVDLATSSFPLFERAWVHQERTLARRTLRFARDHLSFSCATQIMKETQWSAVTQEESLLMQAQPSTSPSELMDAWLGTVEIYSECYLTFSTDRLPALSGLAKRFKELVPSLGDYCAGIWTGDLISGLCWKVHALEYRAPSLDSKYVAPSWSWASVPYHISFVHNGSSFATAYRRKNGFMPYWPVIKKISTAIVSANNGFGQVSAGELQVHGRFRTLYPARDGGKLTTSRWWDIYAAPWPTEQPAVGDLWLDLAHPLREGGLPPYDEVLCLLLDGVNPSTSDPKTPVGWWSRGIVLQPCDPERPWIYRRIGFLQNGKLENDPTLEVEKRVTII